MNLGTIAEINKTLAGFIKTSVSSLADLELGMLGKFGPPGRTLLYQFMDRVEETSVRLGVLAVENSADESQVGRSVVVSENELLRPGWTWFKPSGQKRTTVAIQVTSGGKPLPGALVALWGGLPPFVGKTAEVVTDAQGMARFENVAVLPGMAFKVTRSGYAEKNVVAVPDGTATAQLSIAGFGFKWWMVAVPAGLAGGIWLISSLMGKKKPATAEKGVSGSAPDVPVEEYKKRLQESLEALRSSRRDAAWMRRGEDERMLRVALRKVEAVKAKADKQLKEIEEG